MYEGGSIVSIPKISVIIPVYNGEKYLEQCLESLERQTLKEFEVICVDDGSVDSSLDILNRYMKADDRFNVIHQSNQHAGVARNNGMKQARGEYIIFLDSDDFFDETLLEKTYQKGKENEADIVLFGGRKYNSKTGEFQEAPYYFHRDYLGDLTVFSRKDIPEKIMLVSSPAPWTKLYRRQFVIDEKLEFQNFPNSNDVYFTLLSLCIAERITYVDEALVSYRIGMTENIQSKKAKNPLCFLKAYEALFEELTRRNIFHEVEKSYVDVTLSGCVFNLDTIKNDSARLAIYREINSDSFQKTNALNHPLDFYESQKNMYCVLGTKNALKWHEKRQSEHFDHNVVFVKENTLTEEPTVSVIIPVYNVEKYLKECLDSVINQTLASIEIICVNDGSDDNSLDILKEYGEIDARFTILSQNNSGQSAARNLAIKHAAGEYLYFMDSDDIIELDALEILYNRAKQDEADVVYCDGTSFSDSDECSEQVETYRNYYSRTHEYSGVYTGKLLMKEMLANEEYRVSPCLQMVRREHFIHNDCWFYEGIIHEDNYFNFRCMYSADRAAYIGKSLFRRRVRPDSTMTSNLSFAHVYGYFCCYLKMSEYLQNIEHDEDSEAALEISYRALSNARNVFSKLRADERFSYWGLKLYERTLFRAYVLDIDSVKRNLYVTRMKLQKTYDEKSEINRKLQITYKEKAERGIEIKELKETIKLLKLQQEKDYISICLRKIKKLIKKLLKK